MSHWNPEGWATLPQGYYGSLEARIDRLWAILAFRLVMVITVLVVALCL